jgi:putative transposase
MRQGLLAASTVVGLAVMDELMAVEVARAARPKGKHNPQRVAMRHGTQSGTVTLGQDAEVVRIESGRRR